MNKGNVVSIVGIDADRTASEGARPSFVEVDGLSIHYKRSGAGQRFCCSIGPGHRWTRLLVRQVEDLVPALGATPHT